MRRHQWDQTEALASQARSVLQRAGIEKYSLLCAVQARVVLYRGGAEFNADGVMSSPAGLP